MERYSNGVWTAMVLKMWKYILIGLFMIGTSFALTQPTFYINETCGVTFMCTTENFIENTRLTWTAEANSKYLVIATGNYRHLTDSDSVKMYIVNDSTKSGTDAPYIITSDTVFTSADYVTFEYFDIYQGTGATAFYNISTGSVVLSQNTTSHYTRLAAIRLDNMDNSQFNYSYRDVLEETMDSTYGDDPEDTVNVTITPGIEGDYAIFASALVAAGSTTIPDGLRINITNSTGSFLSLRQEIH